MAVKIHIHTTHRQYTNGLEVVEVMGNTVGDCLSHLAQQFPAIEKALFIKKDKLHNNVEIYLNHTTAYPNELMKPVKECDEIHLVVMLAGG